ncbi:MAG: 5-oxoprolinase subunit PxpB [Akkermansiaceae bacterium]|nr:5-oxoprolinase subunit PxpB [Akkermansiaceae bacterium]MCP5543465.1 5-oxoprolinase subunit PxpB [Akkermansiaceae bacterium]MCP5546806.1 5-oxoprolinase subunit PxpB [Akkermansiaceae bacterium]
MAWCALGDSAWLFEPLDGGRIDRREAVLRMARLLESEPIPGMTDVVTAYETVAVHFDPADGEEVLERLQALAPPEAFGGAAATAAKVVEIPVAYGGTDLEEVAERLGRSPDEIAALHSGASYQVAAIGFSPGFPYLTGLPEQLRIGRKASPGKVEAGSVAIAGGQAGIYPFDSPGGWWVLGRTPALLFDPGRDEPSLLKAGDRVRFVPTDSPPRVDIAEDTPMHGSCEVLDPGGLCVIEDLGRPGFQHAGVSPGGAADPVSARVANLLLGNPEDTAVLECCLRGPKLLFHESTRVAWTGWNDGGRPVRIAAGETLDLGRPPAAVRGYLAVDGGFGIPSQLGSRSTDVRAGFGGLQGRTIAPGDRLPVGAVKNDLASADWKVGWPRAPRPDMPLEIRVLPGMQAAWFADEAFEILLHATYQIGAMSDRMGLRLDGPKLTAGAREMTSQPVVAGSIQVPPDGTPIILLAERQTLGGYPQIAHVVSADLPALGRAWPGTALRFRQVTLEEARDAWEELQRELALLRTGLSFHTKP